MAHVDEVKRMVALFASNRDYMPANGGANLQIAIVDTETTSLIYESDNITELGVPLLEADQAKGDSRSKFGSKPAASVRIATGAPQESDDRATANVPAYRLAPNSPFDSKGALQCRGHSWDPRRRCWHRTAPMTTAKSEACWLRDNVYGWREVAIEFEALDVTLLFSARGGAIARRQLPAALKAA